MVDAIERSCARRSLRDIARRGQDTHEGAAVKVLIADDHRLIIEGVKLKLAELDPAVETVVAMNLDELDRMASTHADSLDLALVDITMPGTQGHQHVNRLRAQAPALPVIVLSGSEDVDLMRSLMEIGVLGFIPKAYSPDVMLSAIRLVLAGGIYIPPLLLANAQAQGWQPAEVAPAPAPGEAARGIDGLRKLLDGVAADVVNFDCAVQIDVRQAKDFPWVAALLSARVKKLDPAFKLQLSQALNAEQVPQLVLTPKP